jgi:hypothetical protein
MELENIEHPTSNAEHRSFHPFVFNSMFDVGRSAFDVSLSTPEAGAPPHCAKRHSDCANVTLLALFFSQPENRKSGNPPFVCKTSMSFLELRHHYCIGTGNRQPFFNFLWQKY